ncbi:MAG: hypothetical protein E7001_06720 [Coriobacteriaceae bacterium]|nr:hypothetical protein [Coriobacteriaceae bacterium]
MTAGDIFCNIMRGSRIKEYFIGGEVFSIPVLWLCGTVVVLIGATVSFLPPRLDIDRVRLLASGSRTVYWRRRSTAVVGYVIAQIAWQLLLCVLIAVALGGSADITRLSPDALRFFSAEGALAWGPGPLGVLLVFETAALTSLTLLTSMAAVVFGAPLSLTVALGYIVISVFIAAPALVPNLMMQHRLTEYVSAGMPAAEIILGILPLVLGCALLMRRLRTIDFLT